MAPETIVHYILMKEGKKESAHIATPTSPYPIYIRTKITTTTRKTTEKLQL